MSEIDQLDKLASRVRAKMIETSHRQKVAHLGGCLSCVDILVALYGQVMQIDPAQPEEITGDKFILSKGHAVHALYTVLAQCGYFPEALLEHYGEPGNPLSEHPTPSCVPGVEIATGSLGHGLSFALGMALAAKLDELDKRFYVLLGDGEINEGSVWEAAMFAPMHGLDNVIAIVDYNQWQATGRSAEVMALGNIADKWEAFGWQSYCVDGHNMSELIEVFEAAKSVKNMPVAIVANTIKGKGVSFMQDDNNWHYRIPSADEVQTAKKELGLA